MDPRSRRDLEMQDLPRARSRSRSRDGNAATMEGTWGGARAKVGPVLCRDTAVLFHKEADNGEKLQFK